MIVGDGLSATAVAVQAPVLLDELYERAFSRGLTVGNPFLIRYCRVGVMNEIGELLLPRVVVLLIGERPGLRLPTPQTADHEVVVRTVCGNIEVFSGARP